MVNTALLKEDPPTSAIIKIVETLTDSLEETKLRTGIFLDFIKTFDCLSHDLFIRKLEHLKVLRTAKTWFQSYLGGRRKVVELKHRENGICKRVRFSPQAASRGVPQGSNVVASTFLLFTNDLWLASYHSRRLLNSDARCWHNPDGTSIENLAITSFIWPISTITIII